MKAVVMLVVVVLVVVSPAASLPSKAERKAEEEIAKIEERHRRPGQHPRPPPPPSGSPPPGVEIFELNPCQVIPFILEVAGDDLTEEDRQNLEDAFEMMCSNTTTEERFFFNRPNPLQVLNTLCSRLSTFISSVSSLVVTSNNLASANASQLIATALTNICTTRSLMKIEERHRRPGQHPRPPPPPPSGSPPPGVDITELSPCQVIPFILEVAGDDLTEEDRQNLEDAFEMMCSNTTSEERFFFRPPNPLLALNILCRRLSSFLSGVSSLVVTSNNLASANASQLIATAITNICGVRSLLRQEDPPVDPTPFPTHPPGWRPPPPMEDDEDETKPSPPPRPSGPPPPKPTTWHIEPKK